MVLVNYHNLDIVEIMDDENNVRVFTQHRFQCIMVIHSHNDLGPEHAFTN